jgi:hypothetical protein
MHAIVVLTVRHITQATLVFCPIAQFLGNATGNADLGAAAGKVEQ